MLILTFLAFAVFAAESPLACNLKGLTAEERRHHAELSGKLRSAAQEIRELPDGFGFRIDPGPFPPASVVEWIGLERKCCPFLRMDLRFEAEGGPLWLHLTGRTGVKEFLREEFKLK